MKIGDENNHYYNGFYRGKVENNGYDPTGNMDADPEVRGRLQIRVLGIHSQNNTESINDGIPTEHLPWAEQAGPLPFGFGPSKGGISSVPEIGSWVWLFFENGNHNKPVYFASVIAVDDLNWEHDGDTVTIVSKTGHKIVIYDDAVTDKGTISIETKRGNAIIIQDSEDEDEIILSSKSVIRLSSEKVIIGSGGGYVVTSPNHGQILTVDGHTLTALENVIA